MCEFESRGLLLAQPRERRYSNHSPSGQDKPSALPGRWNHGPMPESPTREAASEALGAVPAARWELNGRAQ